LVDSIKYYINKIGLFCDIEVEMVSIDVYHWSLIQGFFSLRILLLIQRIKRIFGADFEKLRLIFVHQFCLPVKAVYSPNSDINVIGSWEKCSHTWQSTEALLSSLSITLDEEMVSSTEPDSGINSFILGG
jgi:hypothetical protein